MLLRRVARPMLAAMFIQGGISALQATADHVRVARPVLDAASPAVDAVVDAAPIDGRPDDEMLIRIDAGVKIVAGAMLALGKFPRLASAALAASLIPTTLAGHRFWEETDEARRAEQQIHFFKNVGLLGGLLIAAADTEGKPSMAWRGRRAARAASAAVTAQVESLTGSSGSSLGEAGSRISGVAQDASGAVGGLAAGLVGLAPGAGAALSAGASRAGTELSALSTRAAKAAKRAEKRGAALQKTAEKRGAALQKATAKRRAELQKQAAKRGAKLLKEAERRRAELEKRAPAVREQVVALGHDVAGRASAIGSEVAHQAGDAVQDARARVHAMTR